MVNRGRAMHSRAMERALAEQGELQRASNWARARSRRRIISSSRTSSAPTRIAAAAASARRSAASSAACSAAGAARVGAVAGGINVKKGEANVTLSLVNARTTEEEALTEGYFRKSDFSFGARRRRRLVGRLRGGGRLRLPEYRDRPDHRPRLSRRLQEAGHPARRIFGGTAGTAGTAGALSSANV